jgi:hypothetical protein
MLILMHACKQQYFQQCQNKSEDSLFHCFLGEPTDVEGLFYLHFDAMAEDEIQVTERQQIKVTHL